ncbi:MAG: hypothetical protein CML24_14575 [Rhizobiales bacterium]|nr:hypothetical protein [Hyphomicrobiales bacterium]|tara:strand:+ start:9090 stop:9476 length:387 start_codon:yes stop_codon:yes gene_type:complete
MNVIDIKTRRPFGQTLPLHAEVDILDGFAEIQRSDDVVLIDIRAPRELAGAILEELEAMHEAAKAARSNVVDFKTRRALEIQDAMFRPDATQQGRRVLIECYLVRHQAEDMVRRIAQANRAAAMSMAG